MNHPRTPWIALTAVAALALLATLRTLGGGILSDDLLLDFFSDHSSAALRPDWSRVFADFGRPWLGIPAPLYRPMVSVTIASDLATGGGHPAPFHLTNVALHVTFATLCAALCAQIVDGRKALAALLGGALVALHPVAIEPVAWIAARNSSLELVFHAIALVAFARMLVQPSRLSRACALTGAILALCTKESAVVLPVSLWIVDLLVRRGPTWRQRLRAHLPFLPIWLGYAILRIVIFGALIPGEGASGDAAPLSALAGKLVALFVPMSTTSRALDLLALPLWIAAVAVVARKRSLALTCCGVWLAAHLAPTWRMPVSEQLAGARLVYGALLPLATLLGCAAAQAPRAIAGMTVPMLAVFAIGGSGSIDRYVDAWQEVRQVAHGVAEHADEATADKPLVVTAMPPTRAGIPPFNHNNWFALGWPPEQYGPIRLVSAGYVTVRTPAAELLFHDGSALCALWEQGCTLLTWDPATARFRARRRPDGTIDLPPITRTEPGSNRFAFAPPAPPEHLQQVTIRATRGAHGGRLTWRTAIADLPHELAGLDFGEGVDDGDATRFELDLSHALGLPSLATFGIPLDALEVELQGEARVLALEVAPRVPELPLPSPSRGASFDVARFLGELRAPAIPAGATLRLVVQTAMGAIVVPVTPDGSPGDTVALRDALRVLRAASRDRQILYWFEALASPGKPGFARSAVDRFQLDGGGD